MNKDKEIFERIYKKPGAIWTRTESPLELIELIEGGRIQPCKVIDIGCGEGVHSVYLAKKGFDVTGIDLSENAIKHAKQNAKDAGVDVKFIVMDILDLDKLDKKFDFVLEWAVMHHIRPEQREKYVENVSGVLKDDGKYLSVCFGRQSVVFGEAGEKVRDSGKSAPGLKIYFSSQDELKNLFESFFKKIKTRVISRTEGAAQHVWNYFFMEKNERF